VHLVGCTVLLMKLELSGLICEKSSNFIFYEYTFGGIRIVLCGQTVKQKE
jgi:hypothetical protein